CCWSRVRARTRMRALPKVGGCTRSLASTCRLRPRRSWRRRSRVRRGRRCTDPRSRVSPRDQGPSPVGRGYAPDVPFAPRRTIRRGRRYAPDALFAPRRTIRHDRDYAPTRSSPPRRTIAVGRGYAPDLLFAATRRRVLTRLLFRFRRHQDQELSRRDGASHLSLLVQRNLAQRKHTPPSRPPLRVGFAEPAGFSE